MRQVWIAKGCRSVRGRSTSMISPGDSTGIAPMPASFLKSGRATRMTARASGPPWNVSKVYFEAMPRALITGVSGQDGSYLAELLVAKGYEVHGTVRSGLLNKGGMLPIFPGSLQNSITLHPGHLEEPEMIAALLRKLECDEC